MNISKLVLLPRFTKWFLFFSVLMMNLSNLSILIDTYRNGMLVDQMVHTLSTVLLILVSIDTMLFLFQKANASKMTKEERAKVYREGYEQGRFDESIEQIYETRKEDSISDR
ncbi:hypothetical protein [Paenibacillus lactis]|uniref:hypothetical protein n=1 Tax=Paenibacillus lactis TaxID=228574 RepID=UPI003D74BB72